MQYKIHSEGFPLDFTAVADAFGEADPSSVVDYDASSGLVRVSTVLGDPGIIAVCGDAGWPVAMRQIELVPSECCGGCGG